MPESGLDQPAAALTAHTYGVRRNWSVLFPIVDAALITFLQALDDHFCAAMRIAVQIGGDFKPRMDQFEGDVTVYTSETPGTVCNK
jgi:hypothetical protein